MSGTAERKKIVRQNHDDKKVFKLCSAMRCLNEATRRMRIRYLDKIALFCDTYALDLMQVSILEAEEE